MKLDFHSSCWKRALLVEGKEDARGSAGKMHTLLCTSSSPPFRSHPTTFKTQTKRTTPTTFTPQNACIYATTHQDHTNQSHQPKKNHIPKLPTLQRKNENIQNTPAYHHRRKIGYPLLSPISGGLTASRERGKDKGKRRLLFFSVDNSIVFFFGFGFIFVFVLSFLPCAVVDRTLRYF